jgi:hypothetical protein
MIPFTSEGLIEHLKEKQLEPQVQGETNQIFYIHKNGLGEFPIFLRIYENQSQLQILFFLQAPVPKERIDTIARFLHFLNKEIDLPGFGLDEFLNLVFHRIMIPVYGPHLGSTVLDLYLNSLPGLCDTLFPVINQTIKSQVTFEEIKKNIKSAKP